MPEVVYVIHGCKSKNTIKVPRPKFYAPDARFIYIRLISDAVIQTIEKIQTSYEVEQHCVTEKFKQVAKFGY